MEQPLELDIGAVDGQAAAQASIQPKHVCLALDLWALAVYQNVCREPDIQRDTISRERSKRCIRSLKRRVAHFVNGLVELLHFHQELGNRRQQFRLSVSTPI